MLPVYAELDAKKDNLPMMVLLSENNAVDFDGWPMHDEANACIVRGRVVTVGHLGIGLPNDSKITIVNPRTLRSTHTFFKNRIPRYDAGVLNIKPCGPEFKPARPVIGEDVVLSCYAWNDEAKKSEFITTVGKIVEQAHIKFKGRRYKQSFLSDYENSHLRYIIKSPSCPLKINCGSSVMNRSGELVGIVNGINWKNTDIRYMSSITDILDKDVL